MAMWPSEDELRDAAERLIKKLIELYDMFVGNPDYYPPSAAEPIFESLRLDAQDYLSLDPQRIEDEYERTINAARDVGDNAAATAELELMNNTHLVGWSGPAALEFKRRVTLVREVGDSQAAEIRQGCLCLGTMLALAVESRRSYLELVEATIAAADRALGNEVKRDTKAAISISADVVKDLLALNPETLASGGLSMFIGVAKNVADVIIEGGDAPEVIDSYVRGRTSLAASYRGGLELVRLRLDGTHESLRGRTFPLEPPLDAVTDIDSPDFSYENLKYHAGVSQDFGSRVAEEREKYLADKNAAEQTESSEIGDRLRGAR